MVKLKIFYLTFECLLLVNSLFYLWYCLCVALCTKNNHLVNAFTWFSWCLDIQLFTSFWEESGFSFMWLDYSCFCVIWSVVNDLLIVHSIDSTMCLYTALEFWNLTLKKRLLFSVSKRVSHWHKNNQTYVVDIVVSSNNTWNSWTLRKRELCAPVCLFLVVIPEILIFYFVSCLICQFSVNLFMCATFGHH
jgi:hypothetical protein